MAMIFLAITAAALAHAAPDGLLAPYLSAVRQQPDAARGWYDLGHALAVFAAPPRKNPYNTNGK